MYLFDDEIDFVSEEEYERGANDGEDAGHQAALDNAGTIRLYDPERTPYKDGFDDGFVAGYWATVNGHWNAANWGNGNVELDG